MLAICSNPACGKEFNARSQGRRITQKRYCCRKCFVTHKRDDLSRAFNYVKKGGPDECWQWLGASHGGYGSITIQVRDENGITRHPRSVKAHRFIYESLVGPIPDGQQLLHSCDNPACVNPSHLSVGTLADNMSDRNAKGRQARGEKSGRAKLTESDVRTVLAMYSSGATQVAIAETFDISRRNVRAIITKQSWKHIHATA